MSSGIKFQKCDFFLANFVNVHFYIKFYVYSLFAQTQFFTMPWSLWNLVFSNQLKIKFWLFSVTRYPSGPPPARYNNSPHREHTHKRFDDVAPPGTEGYYDLPPPGVDHLERPTDRSHAPRDPASKNQETEERERGPPREERYFFHHPLPFLGFKISI